MNKYEKLIKEAPEELKNTLNDCIMGCLQNASLNESKLHVNGLENTQHYVEKKRREIEQKIKILKEEINILRKEIDTLKERYASRRTKNSGIRYNQEITKNELGLKKEKDQLHLLKKKGLQLKILEHQTNNLQFYSLDYFKQPIRELVTSLIEKTYEEQQNDPELKGLLFEKNPFGTIFIKKETVQQVTIDSSDKNYMENLENQQVLKKMMLEKQSLIEIDESVLASDPYPVLDYLKDKLLECQIDLRPNKFSLKNIFTKKVYFEYIQNLLLYYLAKNMDNTILGTFFFECLCLLNSKDPLIIQILITKIDDFIKMYQENLEKDKKEERALKTSYNDEFLKKNQYLKNEKLKGLLEKIRFIKSLEDLCHDNFSQRQTSELEMNARIKNCIFILEQLEDIEITSRNIADGTPMPFIQEQQYSRKKEKINK